MTDETLSWEQIDALLADIQNDEMFDDHDREHIFNTKTLTDDEVKYRVISKRHKRTEETKECELANGTEK